MNKEPAEKTDQEKVNEDAPKKIDEIIRARKQAHQAELRR